MRKSLGYIFLWLVLIGFVYATFSVNLESPLDNSFLDYNNNIDFTFNVTGNYTEFNCSIYTNRTGGWVANYTNSTVSNYTSTTHILSNFADAVYIWNINCTNNISSEEDWAASNYTFTVDTIYPNWSINVTYPTSGNPYNTTGALYYFNVSWTDTNLDSVWIEHNFTSNPPDNYTNFGAVGDNYFYNISDLAAGTYYWKMFANDSTGNLNFTYPFVYTVNKANSSINLTVNATSINMGDSVNITGNLTLGQGDYIELYQNGDLINKGSSPLSNISVFNTPGTYNITVQYNSTQNYSYGYETLYITVNDTCTAVEGSDWHVDSDIYCINRLLNLTDDDLHFNGTTGNLTLVNVTFYIDRIDIYESSIFNAYNSSLALVSDINMYNKSVVNFQNISLGINDITLYHNATMNLNNLRYEIQGGSPRIEVTQNSYLNINDMFIWDEDPGVGLIGLDVEDNASIFFQNLRVANKTLFDIDSYYNNSIYLNNITREVEDNTWFQVSASYFSNLTLEQSNITGLSCGSEASCRIDNTTLRVLIISSRNNTELNISHLNPPYTDYTRTISSLTNNFVINITNSSIEYVKFYAYSNSINTLTNTTLRGLYLGDTSINNFYQLTVISTSIEIEGNSTNHFVDFNATNVSNVLIGDFAVLNFTGQSIIYTIDNFMNDDDLPSVQPQIYGNITIINKTVEYMHENASLNRFFPTNIRTQAGALYTSQANVNITRNGNQSFYGTTSSGIIELNLSFNSTTYQDNLTAVINNITITDFVMLNDTPLTLIYDDTTPNITFISPANNSFTNESTVLLNVTTDDLSTCQYILNNASYDNLTTSYTTLHNTSLPDLSDATHNITVNCTNKFSLNTVENISFTVDTTVSQITINYPTHNLTINTQKIELNYTLDEQNPDSVWYTKNYNNTKFSLTYTNSSGINLENITLTTAGWHVLTIYVNDTSGYEASDSVQFFLNLSVNISDWTDDLNESLSDVDSVTPFNSSGDIISNNISTEDSVSLELNFTDITVNIFNFTGTYANWEYLFGVTDNDATFVSDVQSQAGKNPVDYVYFKNFTRFFNQTNDYYGKVKLPKNIGNYTGIFYCDDDDLSNCAEVTTPCSSFTEATATACYNNTANNTYVFVPHFSAVFGDNDTLTPVINITAPVNNSVVGQSYQVSLTFTVNEYSNCGYVKNNGATLTSPSWGTSFTKYINHYVNEQLNLTVNCTDTESNTASSTINITINDITAPVISETVDVTNDDVDIDFTTNEPTNHSVEIDGDSSSTYDETETITSFSTSHSESFNNIGDDDYDYTIIACDQLGNCDTDTGSFTVDTSGDDDDGSSGGGGGGGGVATTASTVSQVWQLPEKGQYLMNIPSTSIAFTEIEFTLKNDLTKNLLMTVSARDLPTYISELKDNDVFQYLKIDKYPITDDDLSSVEIKLRVDRSWLSTNNIDPDTISLWRYTNKWNKITTTKKTTDSSYTYYKVDSPGLSYFAIAGTEIIATPDTGETDQNTSTGSTPTGDVVDEVTTTEEQSQPDTTEEKKKISGFIWIPLIILLLVVGAGAGFIYYQRNISVQTDDELKGLRDYVEKCKSEGIEFKHIRNTLVKAGWSESMIDLVLHDVKIPKQDMDQVLNYINVLRSKGKGDDDIKTNLRKVGWQEEVIEEAMKKKAKKK